MNKKAGLSLAEITFTLILIGVMLTLAMNVILEKKTWQEKFNISAKKGIAKYTPKDKEGSRNLPSWYKYKNQGVVHTSSTTFNEDFNNARLEVRTIDEDSNNATMIMNPDKKININEGDSFSVYLFDKK